MTSAMIWILAAVVVYLLGMLAELYPEMDAEGLTERLARAIFVANLWGRLHA